MKKYCLLLLGLPLLANTLYAAQPSKSKAMPIPPQPTIQRRVFMLETALAPQSPRAVVEMWAKAAKKRNGAIQYMLLCSDLQKEKLATLQQLNWVTGVSSPWIKNYKISSIKNGNKFRIQYSLMTTNNPMGIVVDQIQVVPVNQKDMSSQKWCINQFKYLSPATVRPSEGN